MAANKLALNTYLHDAFNPNSATNPSYLVKNFIDEMSDFDGGSEAKFQHNSVRILPQSNLSNVFNGSSQQIDYQINRGQTICHYDKITLRLQLTNTGGALATVLASHFLIDYIQVNLGGATIETIYAHHLLYNELYLADDDEQVFNDRANRFYSGGIQGTPYTSGGTIAAGATRTFYIEIPCVFTRTECFMPAIEQTVGFRVFWNATALTSTSLATTMQLSDCDILISGREYNDIVKQKLLARYKSYDHVMPYYEPQRTIIPGQAIQSINKTQVRLTEFGGMLSSQIILMVLPQGAVQENLYFFQNTTKFDILRNGNTVSSFQDQPSDWVREQMSQLFNTTAVPSQNIFVIAQSNMPVESAKFGLQRGSLFMTNNDALEIQAAVAGTYDVYVLTYRFCNAVVTKTGQFQLNAIAG